MSLKIEELSNLSKFEVTSDNPFEVFSEWQKKAQDAGVQMTEMFNFSTSDGCGRVSSRYLMLRQQDSDGFIFMTDGRSKKAFDLEQCPRAAMTFLWLIPEPFELIQIRVEGIVKQQIFQDYEHLYTREPLFCKIRTALCRQGEYVDWNSHKKRHDFILENAKETNEELQKPPPHYIIYKLLPEMIEFFYVQQNSIADRVVFRHPYDLCLPNQVLGHKKSIEIGLQKKSKNGVINGNKNSVTNGTENEHVNGVKNDEKKIDNGQEKVQQKTKENGSKNHQDSCSKNIHENISLNGTKKLHTEIFDESKFNRCFNNSLKIQIGVENKNHEICSQDWVHYHIAA